MFTALKMNAVRGGTVTWRPQPWQDGDGGGGEPLSDSDSEEEDFPDDSTTPLGDYVTLGEAGSNKEGVPFKDMTCRQVSLTPFLP